MHDGVQHQTGRVGEYVSLYPLDFLARIVPDWVNMAPLFPRFSRFGYR